MYLSLTTFHFHIFTHKFLKCTLYKLGIPFLCATPASVFSHHVTPIPVPSPLASTQCLQHYPWADSEVQNIKTRLAYGHVNNSFFKQLYHKRNNQLNADSHWLIPWETTCDKFSQWFCRTFKSYNIPVLNFLPVYYCLAASSALPRAPTQAFPTKVLANARAIPHITSTGHGIQIKAMPQTPLQLG
jgi:hypothetical protein